MKRMTAFQLGSCIGKPRLAMELAISAMQNGIRPPVTLVRSWDPLPTLESILDQDRERIGVLR